MKFFTKQRLLLMSVAITAFAAGAFIADEGKLPSLSVAIIENSQLLLDLKFSKAEADSMLSNLEEQREDYQALRKLNINNSVVPALQFNPLPAGYVFPDKSNAFLLKSSALVAVLPANKEELAFYNIRQLGDLIRTRKISSLELTRYFLERLKRYNANLLAVTSFTEELAFSQAKKADEEIKAGNYKGLLHGIPFGIKDLLTTKKYKTTWGAEPYKDQIIDEDATVVKRLQDAGGVLIAKLTLGALAMGDVWYGGKTKNPWDLKRGSSGSSAGPASVVAAGLLPYAIGSETLGSIVSPSAECGDTGLRPTFGRVPKTGAMALSWSMDKLGPITRSVEDCAIVFDFIKGTDNKDLTAINAPFNFNGNTALKGVKIGYLKDDFDRKYTNHDADSATLAKLKSLGAQLVPIKLPDMPFSAMVLMLTAESGAAFQELSLSNRDDLLSRQDKNAWPNTFRSAQFISAVEYINASRARTLLINEMDKMMRDITVYVAPSFSKNLSATNLSGHPCVVLPNGFTKTGRPVSITFMGKLFGEGKLLEVASAYQQATDFHKKHPTLNF